jgi:hypothetical protein
MSSTATAELEAGPTNGALRVVGRAPSSGVRRNSGSVSPTSRPDMRIVHAVRAHDIRVSADGFAASDWSVLSALDEWARRGGPARIDTPLACYLIVSFRWLSSGACLTIVIL